MNELVKIEKREDGSLYVSSRVIAEVLEKEHRRVLQDCREKLMDGSDFVQSSYINSQNKEQPEYLLTKDGFVLLVMNYEGYNEFKIAYIKEFNRMEQELKGNTPALPTNFREAVASLLEEIDKNIILYNDNQRLSLESIENKPKVDFFNAVTDSKDAIPMGDVAKVLDLNIGRNKLFEFLRDAKVLMQNNIPYQSMVDQGYFRVIEQKYVTSNGDINISIKTLVYQKGVNYIRKLLLSHELNTIV